MNIQELNDHHNKAFSTAACKLLKVDTILTFHNHECNITGYTKGRVMQEVLLGASVEYISMVGEQWPFLIKGNKAILLDRHLFKNRV